MASNKNANRANKKFSINEKLARSTLKKVDSSMDELRALIGKQGDGANGGSKTLIGAVEGCNKEAFDGKALCDAYDRFNDVTLPNFRLRVRSIDQAFNLIDKVVK